MLENLGNEFPALLGEVKANEPTVHRVCAPADQTRTREPIADSGRIGCVHAQFCGDRAGRLGAAARNEYQNPQLWGGDSGLDLDDGARGDSQQHVRGLHDRFGQVGVVVPVRCGHA